MKWLVFFLFIATFSGCVKDDGITTLSSVNTDALNFNPTPYNLKIPKGFPDMIIPENNPMTEEGVALGKKLFYDPLLSGDKTMSCASCHNQEFSFSDNEKQFSTGIDLVEGNMNASAIINPGWNTANFWDGRVKTLEDQALGPVANPIEMHLPWVEAERRLNANDIYMDLFKKAFNITYIDSNSVAKAIAQFERTLITANSKYDNFLESGLAPELFFTLSESNGYFIFFTELGDCFHCHGTKLLTDNLFHNNGLDENITSLGYGNVTGNSDDDGKFKTPTLRNIEFTAPYMHDGRFTTLENVIDHYSFGIKYSTTIDPLMKKVANGGIQLSATSKQDLIAFLKTFSDQGYQTNKDYKPE